jgi:hypothetical protein
MATKGEVRSQSMRSAPLSSPVLALVSNQRRNETFTADQKEGVTDSISTAGDGSDMRFS